MEGQRSEVEKYLVEDGGSCDPVDDRSTDAGEAEETQGPMSVSAFAAFVDADIYTLVSAAFDEARLSGTLAVRSYDALFAAAKAAFEDFVEQADAEEFVAAKWKTTAWPDNRAAAQSPPLLSSRPAVTTAAPVEFLHRKPSGLAGWRRSRTY